MTSLAVTSAEVSWLRVPFAQPLSDSTHTLSVLDIVLLELEDVAGHRGTAYMLGFDYATSVLFEIAIDAAKVAVGTDARMRNQTWQRLWTGYEYVGQSGVAAWGVSIVDLALWDLYGHQLGQPVWALLGGARRSTPAYGSGGWLSMSEQEIIAEAENYLTLGLGGYKMKVGRGVEEDVKRVRAVRRALGNDVPLMVDANQRYDLASARRLSDGLAELGLLWLEEPMSPDRVADYVRLRECSTIPLAMGERAYYPSGLAEIVRAGGVDVVQPDALRIGGVRGWLDTASMAAGANLTVAPHFYREFDATLAAATDASIFVENFFWTDPIFAWEGSYQNGTVTPSDAPGFGLKVKDEARKNYLVRRELLSLEK
jgi:L-alanine-DL-glutamate epimerase-like enolase superfamily enzyme